MKQKKRIKEGLIPPEAVSQSPNSSTNSNNNNNNNNNSNSNEQTNLGGSCENSRESN